MWRRNTCGQPPSILQTRFNKFCTWKHVNPHSLKKLCMLYSHLWKKKKFRPKYWKQMKCNACAQEVVWDPKDPDEGAGDGASSNHRFLHPFLVVIIKQSLKVADQDCDIDARGEGGGGDHCWGGKHRLQQNQGGQDDDDAQLIFLFPKIKIPFDWGTITDSCDYVLYRVPMCIVV